MKRSRRMLPLNAMRAFEAAARLGRATAAADELGVTHGAVSRQIAQLEAALGVELFVGTRGRPTLSQTGRSLAADLTPAFDRLEQAVRPFVSRDKGVLHVACLGSFAFRWIIPRLHRFARLHPDIDVRFGSMMVGSDARQPKVDLAIDIVESPTALREDDRLLFREQIGLVIAPELAGSHAVAELAGFRKIVSSTRPDVWSEWASLTGSHPEAGPGEQPMIFEHYHVALQATLCGLGVCIAPRHLVLDDLAAGRLRAPYAFRDTGYCYVLRGLDSRSQKATCFSGWLEAELQQAGLRTSEPQPPAVG